MKSFRLLTLAVLVTPVMLFHAAAFAMGPEHTGSWFNQNESGHGFSIEYGDDGNGTPLVVVYWYVYDKDGSPVFLTGTGYPDSTGVDITFYAHYGMEFGVFDPATHQERDGGIASFNFQDEENGTFEYFPSIWTIQNFGFSQHQMPITKLFGVTHPNEEPPPTPPPTGEPVPLEGLWSGRMVYDRGYSGNGTCYDADVLINIDLKNAGSPAEYHWIEDTTVDRDGGSTSSYGGSGSPTNNYVTSEINVFGMSIEFSIRFDDYGQAEGSWRETYNGNDCYGTWSFQKIILPPPPSEPVPLEGLWSGRMVYDRGYSGNGTCYDADVLINIDLKNAGSPAEYHWIEDTTVDRDGGNTSSYGGSGSPTNNYVTSEINVFGMSIEFSIRFDDYGQAEGSWRETYNGNDCYGTWSFQKE